MGGAKHTKKADGFTIIEVLIVMAIAGLIMVVVFLAVPALQRNSRNQARRADARLIASQRFQYNVDNNTSASIAPAGAKCDGSNASFLFCNYIKDGLGAYELKDVYFQSNTNIKPSKVDPITDPKVIRTESYTKCDANKQYAIVGDRKIDMTVTFLVETRTGWQSQCVQNDLAPKS